MEFNYKFNGGKELEAALKKLPNDLARKAGESAVRAGGNVIKKGIQEKAKGHLKVSIVVRKDKAGQSHINYVVASKSPVAHLEEFGTAAHTIESGTHRGHKTDKKVLSDGNVIFGKIVRHPGTQPTPFFRPGIDESMPEALIKMQETMARAIKNQAVKFTRL